MMYETKAKVGFVIFSTARTPSPSPYYRLLSWLIRVLTRSPISHCGLAFEGRVMDPTIQGVFLWPLSHYFRHARDVHCVLRVRFRYRIDLDFFQSRFGRQVAVWPTVQRWLSRGRYPWTADCVCTVIDCLHAGGVPVPRTIHTPIQLYRWLLASPATLGRFIPCPSSTATMSCPSRRTS